MSDGQHYLQAMLGTQLNHLVESNTLTKNGLITLTTYATNVVQGRRYVASFTLWSSGSLIAFLWFLGFSSSSVLRRPQDHQIASEHQQTSTIEPHQDRKATMPNRTPPQCNSRLSRRKQLLKSNRQER